MKEIIRDQAIKHLPFQAQSIQDWDEECDCHEFLRELFNEDVDVIHESGTSKTVNLQVYGTYLFTAGLKEVKRYAKLFEESAKSVLPAPASTVKNIAPVDLTADPNFGLTCKYLVAWDGITHQILSESAFFSIGHLLESQADLECSVDLAARMYYKQAILVLRGFLESLILPIGFTDNPRDFIDWREGRFHTPPLRGKNGLLTNLVNRGLIPVGLADEAADLYGDFNAYVHGSEDRLIHGGFHRGAYRGLVYLPDQLELWSRYLTRSVDLGIRLMALHTAYWGKIRPNYRSFCGICHETKDFTIETYVFAKREGVKRTCKVCGSVSHFDSTS